MYRPPDPPKLTSGLVRTLRVSELTSTVDPVPKPLCKKIGIWSPKRVFLKLIQLYREMCPRMLGHTHFQKRDYLPVKTLAIMLTQVCHFPISAKAEVLSVTFQTTRQKVLSVL